MSSPRIALATTCKGRTQHLELTLPHNIADNAEYENCVFVVVDYASRDHLGAYLRKEHAADIASGRLVVYSYTSEANGFGSSDVPFHMAHAKNLAHRVGILEGAEILVNLDADNYTGFGFAQYIADQFAANGNNSFLWAKMVRGVLPRGISGRIVVTSRAFLLAGGYDQQYNTWAPDDKDFNERLRRLGFEGYEIDHAYLGGVPHNDKMRFREYPHAKATMGEDEFDLSRSTATIANFGNFGCATVFRNFDYSDPIQLSPLPTRIFGIGMHKTATTSLHTALTILGYDSAHWKTAHWAKKIWTEMMSENRSMTLERSYALCDLPITLLYDRLDRAYPGSKFILTLRNEDGWVESARRHWRKDLNPHRKQWDHDPFSHFIHKELYGQRNFDEQIFRDRFRRHNLEVEQYFATRPQDLLKLDVDQGHGWPELCRFLGKPIPLVPYPMAFTGGDSAATSGYLRGDGEGV